MATFDVFDSSGEFTQQVNVRGSWNGRSDSVFFLDDDHAVVVTGFADAMVTQFTGGHMTVDLDSEAGSMEVIYSPRSSIRFPKSFFRFSSGRQTSLG